MKGNVNSVQNNFTDLRNVSTFAELRWIAKLLFYKFNEGIFDWSFWKKVVQEQETLICSGEVILDGGKFCESKKIKQVLCFLSSCGVETCSAGWKMTMCQRGRKRITRKISLATLKRRHFLRPAQHHRPQQAQARKTRRTTVPPQSRTFWIFKVKYNTFEHDDDPWSNIFEI